MCVCHSVSIYLIFFNLYTQIDFWRIKLKGWDLKIVRVRFKNCKGQIFFFTDTEFVQATCRHVVPREHHPSSFPTFKTPLLLYRIAHISTCAPRPQGNLRSRSIVFGRSSCQSFQLSPHGDHSGDKAAARKPCSPLHVDSLPSIACSSSFTDSERCRIDFERYVQI